MSDSESNSETGKEIKTETIDNLKDEIERIVLTFDAVELLACLSSLWYFVPENKVPSDTCVSSNPAPNPLLSLLQLPQVY
jgi:hypothetical protein